MALAPTFRNLALPVIGAPMFIVSSPDLVVAQCHAGIVGTMPSLNVREADELERVLCAIAERLAGQPGSAPFGINLIAHQSNARLEHDLAVCVRQQVPLIITSLGPSAGIVEQVHGYGGIVFHDVINARHARKAIATGVDGIIAVCAGAGGHGGIVSPFALCAEVRDLFDGTLVLAGAISRGADIAAARAMGADLVYVGTRLIATREANAVPAYKAMILASGTSDILYSSYFSGVSGNYLQPSVVAAGIDPSRLGRRDADTLAVSADGTKAKAWKDVWSAGHGVGAIHDVPAVADLVDRWCAEFAVATRRLTG